MAKILGAIAPRTCRSSDLPWTSRSRTSLPGLRFFEAYRPVRRWLEEKKPDVLLLTYNDHVTSFFFDHYSQFTLGIGESYEVADQGGDRRPLPPVRGHAAWPATLPRA